MANLHTPDEILSRNNFFVQCENLFDNYVVKVDFINKILCSKAECNVSEMILKWSGRSRRRQMKVSIYFLFCLCKT